MPAKRGNAHLRPCSSSKSAYAAKLFVARQQGEARFIRLMCFAIVESTGVGQMARHSLSRHHRRAALFGLARRMPEIIVLRGDDVSASIRPSRASRISPAAPKAVCVWRGNVARCSLARINSIIDGGAASLLGKPNVCCLLLFAMPPARSTVKSSYACDGVIFSTFREI